jgi:bifunctional polynucleotide phosphatase/kinase
MKRKGEAISQTNLNKFFNIKEYVKWKKRHSVLVGSFGDFQPTSKVASFDFDGTIACLKGKHTWPIDGNDWRWFDSSVPAILNHLILQGYCIVIFSNQKGIEKDSKSKNKQAFVGRIENTAKNWERYCKQIGLDPSPILFMAATADDCFRKPRMGMWYLYQSLFPDVEIDISNSFFCGDAAGRPLPGPGAHTRDHSDTDRKFGLNLGIKFYVPHQIFNTESLEKYRVNNNQLHISSDLLELPQITFDPSSYQVKCDIPVVEDADMIICVGSPASGKTLFCETVLQDYIHVNQDILGTKSACINAAKKALASGLKVVIDNTNPQQSTRIEYISLAVDKRVVCLHFKIPKAICSHNNLYREHAQTLTSLKENRTELLFGKYVPYIAMNTFWSKLEEPSVDEGFEKVIELPFVPNFHDQEHEKHWRIFYS